MSAPTSPNPVASDRPRTTWVAFLITLVALIALAVFPILVAPAAAAILIAGLVVRISTKNADLRARAATTIWCSAIVVLTAALGAFFLLPAPWFN